MIIRSLLIALLLSPTSASAEPYSVSGNVFNILAVPTNVSAMQLEENYANLIALHSSDALALKILEYARIRVRLMRGFEWIGETQIRSFESLSKKQYRPDSDLFYIYNRLFDHEHKERYLSNLLLNQNLPSVAYLAILNAPNYESDILGSIVDPIGDLNLYNRRLARDLYLASSRLEKYPDVSSADMLYRIFNDVLSAHESRSLSSADKGALLGLLLDVGRRLPQAEKLKFILQVESKLTWINPLATFANSNPLVSYFNPERERILRNVRNWLIASGRKPGPSLLNRLCLLAFKKYEE